MWNGISLKITDDTDIFCRDSYLIGNIFLLLCSGFIATYSGKMYESSCRPLQAYLIIFGYKWDCIFLNFTVCIFLCEVWASGHTISACSLSQSVKHNMERWLELLCPCFIDLQLFLYLSSLCLATGCVRHSISNTPLCCSHAKRKNSWVSDNS